MDSSNESTELSAPRPAAPMVYQAIADITGELARRGIAKDRKNAQQGFAFRGIDDVYGALAPLLSRHRLVILPEVIERTATERQTRSGGALFHVSLRLRYTLVSALDGSTAAVVVDGEAMDSADKATSKALSISYKSMAFMLFSIPVEGQDNDPDATSHEVSSAASDSAVLDIATLLGDVESLSPGSHERWMTAYGQRYARADNALGLAIPQEHVPRIVKQLRDKLASVAEGAEGAEA